MTFIKTPAKGMRDFTPKQMALREYILNIMKETYAKYGFELISTPVVEHIENLTSKQGGENEKLIFKIMKRGEKLNSSNLTNPDSLVDSGLRYDLTVPLARFYANNKEELSFPFRSFQTGYSYRAERPQKGRYRELMQCDLDILGEKTNLAEIELITAVITFLNKLELDQFKIKINDREILKAMLKYADFKEEDSEQVMISLDKMDKIGQEVVKEELIKNGIEPTKVQKYLDLFSEEVGDIANFCAKLPLNEEVTQNLIEIKENVLKNTNAQIVFDPTLVRGMGYYTGPIFEIEADGLSSSIGGGGRYDHMIEKYANISIPACGFSVGFERLILILEEKGFEVPTNQKKYCYLLNKEATKEEKSNIIILANEKRQEENTIVKILYKNKNYKYQKETLEKENYIILN